MLIDRQLNAVVDVDTQLSIRAGLGADVRECGVCRARSLAIALRRDGAFGGISTLEIDGIFTFPPPEALLSPGVAA